MGREGEGKGTGEDREQQTSRHKWKIAKQDRFSRRTAHGLIRVETVAAARPAPPARSPSSCPEPFYFLSVLSGPQPRPGGALSGV